MGCFLLEINAKDGTVVEVGAQLGLVSQNQNISEKKDALPEAKKFALQKEKLSLLKEV